VDSSENRKYFMMAGCKYDIGELVLYKDEVCLVTDIQATPLGFSRYQLSSLDSGELHTVAKHEISKVDFLDMDDTIAFEIDDQKPAKIAKRHAELDDQDLDEVARQRLSAKTESQTRWAVAVFKGI
jgi:hypothetical protein